MRWVFLVVVGLHGLIHLMGFAKAFGFAELEALTQPVSQGVGILWLVAALAMLATAVALPTRPRAGWAVGAVALVLSQIAIGTAWTDAKFGTVANVVVLAGVVYGLASAGPWSLRAAYEREVATRLERLRRDAPLVTEADLAPLPEPVARYVRRSGAVGSTRVQSVAVRWTGRIRSSADARWMDFTAEQHNFYDTPARLFHMRATMLGVPIDVLHAFVETGATMRVRAASLVPVADARGPEMDRAETVTLFNDLCILAPAALVDPAIRWEPLDARRARGTFTHTGQTVSAVLVFDEAGDLVDFVSDDRLRSSADGRTFTRERWSTPVGAYHTVGGRRIATKGETRWHAPEGEFAYGEFVVRAFAVDGAELLPPE